MLIEFWLWWYGAGWLEIVHRVGARVVTVWQIFSVSILLRTLFSPWKRIISPPGKSIDAIVRGMVDNAVSRVVGFFARVFVLITALLLTAFASLFGVAMVIIWPFMPLATIGLILWGLKP